MRQRTSMRGAIALLGVLAMVAALPITGFGEVPQQVNYQGHISVDGSAFDGTGQFKFAIVNADASETYWSNDGTSTFGGEPTTAVQVDVFEGIYSVSLGDTTLDNMTAVEPSVFQNDDVHLRIWFNDGTYGFQLLEPDQRITAVAYAMVADRVTDGGITGSMIANNTIGEAKLDFAPLNLDTSSIYESSTGNIGIGTTSPYAALDVNGQLRIRNDHGLFFADNGYIGSKDGNHRILFRRPENKIELREFGEIIFSPGSIDGEETAKVVMKADGKMGIGIDSPNALLHAFGGSSSDDVTAVKGEAFGSNTVGVHGKSGLANSTGTVGVLGHASGDYSIGGKFYSLGYTYNVGIWIGTQNNNIIEGYSLDTVGDPRDLEFRVTQHGNVYADGTYESPAADFAESVSPIGNRNQYEPGDVLIIALKRLSDSSSYGFKKSETPYSTSVAGVYSTEPGFIGGAQENDDLEADNNIPMAVIGIVPCKVSGENGPIEAGDLLVTSSTPGHAMRGTDRLRMLGAIVGKALEGLDSDVGMIDVLVTLQ